MINKILIYLTSIFFLFNLSANSFVLEKTPIELNFPWGMSWISSEELLITQKTGEIIRVNVKNLTQTEISHKIPSVASLDNISAITSQACKKVSSSKNASSQL